ncbi:Signal recognition particle receptor subunit alpha-like protein [Diplonema papillatum]|nr:Signal recognition particle receptor subunit alpha-like protein [Diplonema papillatum]|eukprot:gene319-445_t
MIDEFVIFHRGGLVLWKMTFAKIRGNPVNQLVKGVLLEDRVGLASHTHDVYKMEWLLDNDHGIVFVAVYQQLLALGYIADLLEEAKDSFLKQFAPSLARQLHITAPTRFRAETARFDGEFSEIVKAVETVAEELRAAGKRDKASAPPRADPEADKDAPGDDDSDGAGEEESESPGPAVATEEVKEKVLQGRAALIAKMRKRQDAGPARKSVKAAARNKPAPKKKPQRKWNDPAGGPDGGAADPSYTSEPEDDRVIAQTVDPVKDATNLDEWQVDDEPRSRFQKFLRERFGNREVDKRDVEAILPELRETMTSKNVAQGIADSLCASASAELTGKKIPNLTSLSTTIKQSLTASLLRILTPKRDVNILRDVAKAREQNRPFVICFCGVNGVGKSTSLSKVAYWLKGNNLSVLIAACDTFRSGAVEQLKVHCGRIGVPLFAKGYSKDATEVAKEAIAKARKEAYDVVLVDTAGRMQGNEPLMRSLAKLIHTNKPDVVLFVGEALVGNDGVDQLKLFNKSLVDHTPTGEVQRGIDGIILTKFDTIDDKVGAAISMVYESGQPIVFVGVGQDYQDLRQLNPAVVVQTLLN